MRLLITLDMGEMPDHECASLSPLRLRLMIQNEITEMDYRYSRVDKENDRNDVLFRIKKGGGE